MSPRRGSSGWGSRYASFDGEFPRATTVAERRAEAEGRLAQLREQGREAQPVVVDGRQIATTFWGKSWCEHLERYSDYATRLPRGRSYLRHGCVIDLQISKGKIAALVSGSSLYEVEIAIRPLDARRWKDVVRQCAGQIESMVELLSGRLSDSVMGILVQPENGVFPADDEISLSCSCPDGARLCKHLAAVLYGVGSRLDAQPELLFLLRGVDQSELIAGAASDLTRSRARPALGNADLSALFGIELATGGSVLEDVDAAIAPPKRRRGARPARRKRRQH